MTSRLRARRRVSDGQPNARRVPWLPSRRGPSGVRPRGAGRARPLAATRGRRSVTPLPLGLGSRRGQSVRGGLWRGRRRRGWERSRGGGRGDLRRRPRLDGRQDAGQRRHRGRARRREERRHRRRRGGQRRRAGRRRLLRQPLPGGHGRRERGVHGRLPDVGPRRVRRPARRHLHGRRVLRRRGRRSVRRRRRDRPLPPAPADLHPRGGGGVRPRRRHLRQRLHGQRRRHGDPRRRSPREPLRLYAPN